MFCTLKQKYIYFSIKKIAIKDSFIIMLKLLKRIYTLQSAGEIRQTHTEQTGIHRTVRSDTYTNLSCKPSDREEEMESEALCRNGNFGKENK